MKTVQAQPGGTGPGPSSLRGIHHRNAGPVTVWDLPSAQKDRQFKRARSGHPERICPGEGSLRQMSQGQAILDR